MPLALLLRSNMPQAPGAPVRNHCFETQKLFLGPHPALLLCSLPSIERPQDTLARGREAGGGHSAEEAPASGGGLLSHPFGEGKAEDAGGLAWLWFQCQNKVKSLG